MKEAVAIDIRLSRVGFSTVQCAVSLYPSKRSGMAARKERLRLSAMAVSSEQDRRTTIGDSAFMGFARYAKLFKNGKTDFVFREDLGIAQDSSMSSFASDLGLSIARNANLVQCLRVGDAFSYQLYPHRFLKDLFSLSVEGAFPSLRSAYLGFEYSCGKATDLPPHIMKHLRCLRIWAFASRKCDLTLCAKQIGNMIRNKDYGIEEVIFSNSLLRHAELLDDTLSSLRSFHVSLIDNSEVGRLAGSFKRTEAEGDKLVQVSLPGCLEWVSATVMLVETIVRTRPNLKVLELGNLSYSTFNVVCDVVAPSVLTTLKVSVDLRVEIDGQMSAGGMAKLLQHPTIRDLYFEIASSPPSRLSDLLHDFVQIGAEGLRATRLRRFDHA